MGWDPQTPLRGRKGGFTPPYSYTYLFTGIRYNLRNAIKNGDVVKKFWNLLFLIPKTYKKHGKVVSCLENFFNPRDSSGQLWLFLKDRLTHPKILRVLLRRCLFFQWNFQPSLLISKLWTIVANLKNAYFCHKLYTFDKHLHGYYNMR